MSILEFKNPNIVTVRDLIESIDEHQNEMEFLAVIIKQKDGTFITGNSRTDTAQLALGSFAFADHVRNEALK